MATIGPATWSETDGDKMIEKLLIAGVDVCRLNFSHGSYEEKEAQIRDIRAASERLGRHVAIVQDLQGPKIRLGDVKDNSLFVKVGDELILDYALKSEEHDGSHTIPLQYNLAEKVKPGEVAYIWDGKVKTIVEEIVSPTAIKVSVKNDGEIKKNKGINLPDTDFGDDVFPEKDLRDIEWGADKGFDYVAFSFIQNAANMREGRELLKKAGYPDTIKIIAKIETKQATKDDETMTEIAKESDVIMVARGDMGYEVGAEVVPVIQRKLILASRRNNALVIVATQTMASMEHAPVPTRAEADNVAAAVILGADAIMLSEETAVGEFPIETIETLRKIIFYTQDHELVDAVLNAEGDVWSKYSDAVCSSAWKIATKIDASNIVAETDFGWTAERISARRPNCRVIAVTGNKTTAQQLAMCYGVDSYVKPYEHNYGLKLAQELKTAGRLDPENDESVVVVVSGRDQGFINGVDTIQVRGIKK
jgi:pyruvate kinase